MAFFTYRKNLERLLYVLALAGVGLTLHIALWYSEGGSAGADPLCSIGSDCTGVIASDPAPLGIPSAWWGFLFYITIAVGSVLISRNISGLGSQLIKGRMVIVGLGWIYSLFLTLLQATAIDGWCQLCLYSFSIVTLIAGVTLYSFLKKSPTNSQNQVPKSEPRFHGIAALALLVLLGWDYYNVPENLTSASSTTSSTTAGGPQLCTYASDSPTFDNIEQLIMDYDPVFGPEDAPVIVMEFLDPNCNHCKAVHPNIKALAEAYPDSVRVIFKPVPIVGGPTHSLDEIAALYYANDHGVFEEMLDLVFEHQSPATGLSVDRLAEFADDLGLNEANFRRALSRREFASRTVQTRRFFEGMGFTGVPVVIINGRRVSSSSRSEYCLKRFIELAEPQS
ncbi:MAG: vitamin K epoxide reductase family protein [Rhodothermaceae bacterium]|nr:vitamin K epoxide reductase family protein [Bacteroidota bacterium]MXW15418.1 vitamin K epoxide reductase family protein [Rhodothermaceae bacterium]MDE2644388.1 vitamin K epoxide reductase family protein [Bacteroidota bacterium]MXW31851.1 vitamin K epoxide reductase family protein [Rhodothermaceae bacterium]MXX96371.1 vitamin K epoxide reductase family protein [Rhodothermaceae bacterium]